MPPVPRTAEPAQPPPPPEPPLPHPPSPLPHPPPPVLAVAVTWEAHEQRNCWWDGHGSEEVDSPKGHAVTGVKTLAACKESCVAAAKEPRKPFCEGVIYDPANNNCYRKTNIDLHRCPTGGNLNLYLRIEANRPPGAPRPDYSATSLNSAKCSAHMRDPRHKFYTIWGRQGWRTRGYGQEACWGDGNWFDWVAGGNNCNQNWGPNLKAPTVFGFAESMEAFCNEKAGRGWTWNSGDPTWACGNAGLNILRTGSWNMCRNAEWMVCVVQGKACWGGGGDGQILFSIAPSMLDMADFDSRQGFYSENDIYYLEVCVLNEMCSNHDELFTKAVGEPFFCKFDRQRWLRAKREMLALG